VGSTGPQLALHRGHQRARVRRRPDHQISSDSLPSASTRKLNDQVYAAIASNAVASFCHSVHCAAAQAVGATAGWPSVRADGSRRVARVQPHSRRPLTPPPYQHPERLVVIPSARTDGQPAVGPTAWAAAQWTEWQKEATAFDAIAAYTWSFNFWSMRDGSESLEDLVIRTAADPRSLMAAVQRELRSVDPTVAVENVRTLEQIRGDSLASRTFAMQLLVGFSVVAAC